MMEYRDGLDRLLGYWRLCLTLLASVNNADYDFLLVDPGVRVIVTWLERLCE